MAKNDSRTRAFATANHQKSYKSKKRIRQQVVISIFAVIALILIVFATLIIGKIISLNKLNKPTTPPSAASNTVPREETAIHIGNLLLIDKEQYKFNFANQLEFENVLNFKSNSQNTHIDIDGTSYPTYSQNQDIIVLEKNALIAFNQLMFDYCSSNVKADDIFNSASASGLQIAWGGYVSETDYYKDLNGQISGVSGADYVDHALGTTVTLRKMPPYSDKVVSEALLMQDYKWIYDHAHEYGFILRFPNKCEDHTGFNGLTRIHLRYIGVEHATYIHDNGCCLEEYLELLRTKHTYTNPLTVSVNGKTYDIYYVEYSGEPTSVPVPKDKKFEISGDNMNGFIVTVEK